MYFVNPFYITAVFCHTVLWLLRHQADADIYVKSPRNQTLVHSDDLPAASSFGVPFPEYGLVGHLAYTDPPDACTQIEQPTNTSRWIAVISMSDKCDFYEQVLNAQKAQFIAAIVHNNKSDVLIEMTNASKLLHIPSTFISLSFGRLLEQYDRRLDVYVLIVESDSGDGEILLIILAAISGFSAVVVVSILIGIGVHNCCKNRAQLLSRWKLKRLPQHVFKKGDLYENCAICLEEYNEGDKLRILPCAHAYHSKCIDVWLTKNRKTCPLCNDTVDPGRRKKSRAPSESDNERTPLLMPVSNDDDDSEQEQNADLLNNQSSVEVHVHPTSVHTAGRRDYGAAAQSSALVASLARYDSSLTTESINDVGPSVLCHAEPRQSSSQLPSNASKRWPDSASPEDSSRERETRSGGRPRHDARTEQVEVVTSGGNRRHNDNNLV